MSMATEAILSLTSKQLAALVMVSRVTSRARGAASLGVEAWLVSVSYVTGADREELHGEEGQQESQEQLELWQSQISEKSQYRTSIDNNNIRSLTSSHWSLPVIRAE